MYETFEAWMDSWMEREYTKEELRLLDDLEIAWNCEDQATADRISNDLEKLREGK